jgi:Tol biopolymer transport system component
MRKNRRAPSHVILIGIILILVSLACQTGTISRSTETPQSIPQGGRWGIYQLSLEGNEIQLIYATPERISGLDLDENGNRLVFAQFISGSANENSEIMTISTDGTDLKRLTENNLWDLYPAWSPDGSQIAFLTWRADSLDIYRMDSSGSSQQPLFASEDHDADISWAGEWIAFTRQSRIWLMHPDGSDPHPLTQPPRAGEWGNANLPFGDYDPRLNPDGTQVVFSRLVDDASQHGNYDFYMITTDGTAETRLTQTGYAQGLSSWSHDGKMLLFIVAAIGEAGKYDLYLMNADGSDQRNITPAFFPDDFLVNAAVFSADDQSIYFIGELYRP